MLPVAYVARWSTEVAEALRGSSAAVSFTGYIICRKFHFTAWQCYRSHIMYLFLFQRVNSILSPPFSSFLFFAAVKVEGCDVIPKKSLIQARRTKWGCLQLYRHSFFHMLCLNMPLMAVYIYIYICMYFSLNYWCLIAQGCRKSYKVLRALWELEWFMRLCCFCSMRKLDVAYRILPCCYCCRVCSCCLALMLRHVAESALSIHALSAWP